MTQTQAFQKAAHYSQEKRTTRYVIYDGPDFGADSCGQGGYQVTDEADLYGFYDGCPIIACFVNGQIDE